MQRPLLERVVLLVGQPERLAEVVTATGSPGRWSAIFLHRLDARH